MKSRQPEQSNGCGSPRPNRPGASARISILRPTDRRRKGGPVLHALDAEAVRRWSRAAVERLEAHRDEIDALNVYPVPDSDTGSNLVTTLRAADAALAAGRADTAAAALNALATGAAQGALGNSGFIASQILRGFADATAEAGTGHCDAAAARA